MTFFNTRHPALNMALERAYHQRGSDGQGSLRELSDAIDAVVALLDDATSASHGQAPAQAAPQQEAQEPVAWYVTGCGRLLDEDEAKAEARHIGGTARAIPLYTAPQADSVLEDAKRYRWLRQEHKRVDPVCHLTWKRNLQRDSSEWVNTAVLDTAIDAARKQGENHD